MSAYRPYPKYKPSGVEWPGDVPEGWDVKPLKFAANLLTRKSIGRRNAIGLENIESWSGRFIDTETEFDGEGVAVEAGDILFGKLRPYLAKALLITESSDAVGDFHAMRPQRGTHAQFLLYQILSKEFIVMVDGSTFGSKMSRASWEFVGKMPLPLPPLPEQIQIASFLDRECGKLDALQAKQQRLIELLKEKRQALISHAVTRGLNPTAKLKPSGIEWLGDVPEHWVASKVKWVSVTVKTGGTPADPSWFTDEPEVPWLTPGDFTEDFFKISPRRYVSQAAIAKREAPSFPSSSIFVIGIGATLGKAARLEERQSASSNQQINAIVPSKRIESDYLLFSLVAQTEQMKNCSNASTLGIMNQEKTKGLHIPLPPLAEQRAIVAHLDEKCGKIDQLKAKAERGIELLKERRSALISAAVTGKIDVRDV